MPAPPEDEKHEAGKSPQQFAEGETIRTHQGVDPAVRLAPQKNQTKRGSHSQFPIVGSIVLRLLPALEGSGNPPGPYPIKFDSHFSQGGWAGWITWTTEPLNKSGLVSVRFGDIFCQLFTRFYVNPCEFYHTQKNQFDFKFKGFGGVWRDDYLGVLPRRIGDTVLRGI